MHNLCDQCETVAHCLTNGCIPLQPVWDTGPTNKDVEAALQSKRLAKLVAAAQSAPVPTSWMEMVTANLVREGVNKHTARELAEHFYRLHPFAAQPAPVQSAERGEPVATKLETQQFNCFHVSAEDFQRLKALPVGAKLYTTPPAAQRQWVGLTQDEFRDFASTFEYGTGGLIRAIEAKLKEKNT